MPGPFEVPCSCCASPPPPPAHNYIQASQCSDGALVDLWFVRNADGTIQTNGNPTTALPFYFYKSGIAYQVQDFNPTSSVPGTLASGYVVTTSCPVVTGGYCPTCVFTASATWTVLFFGVTLANCEPLANQPVPETRYKWYGNPNKFHCLTKIPDVDCQWLKQGPNAEGIGVRTYDSRTDPSCAATAATIGYSVRLAISHSHFFVSLQSEGTHAFIGSVPRSDGENCEGPIQLVNASPGLVYHPGPFPIWGGSSWLFSGYGGVAFLSRGC